MRSPNISEDFIINQRKEIGARLKAIRETIGYTLEQIQDLTGYDTYTLSKVEAGKWNYPIEYLIVITSALEVDIKLILK
ncbi:MAG TPA: helix-turn-helix transcriptional regulator [Mucilaginibacter sp.]|jgi:transcriptional regulator with XRE-family HTH domain